MKRCRKMSGLPGRILLIWLSWFVIAGQLAGCGQAGQSGAAGEAKSNAAENSDGAEGGGQTGGGTAGAGQTGGGTAGTGQTGDDAARRTANGASEAIAADAGDGSALPEGWTPSLTAIITSDLHYDQDVRFSVFPLMQHIDEIAEIMADAVISRHPDVFIMTGDNTNSGSEEDVAALTAILHRIHAAGIEVIVTTGNHDFDKGHFWEPYDGLCTPVSRDSETESMAVDIGGFRFLAMDDNSVENWVGGMLPESTLAWMGEAMDTENEVIFLSHHNVLPGGEESLGSTYVIQVPELRDVLADAGVRLCLSGHRHTQEILRYRDMYEIISSPLAAAPHQFGVLELGGGWYRYRTEVLDLGMKLLREEAAGSAERTESIAASADFSGRRQFKKEKILALFGLFMDCVANGSLADRRDEILGSEYYEDMLETFADTNYGPWIRARMAEKGLPGNRLVIRAEGGKDESHRNDDSI